MWKVLLSRTDWNVLKESIVTHSKIKDAGIRKMYGTTLIEKLKAFAAFDIKNGKEVYLDDLEKLIERMCYTRTVFERRVIAGDAVKEFKNVFCYKEFWGN